MPLQHSLKVFVIFMFNFWAGENHHQPDLWGWHGFKAKFDQKKLWMEDTITKPVLWSFWYMWSSLKPCNPTGETSACQTLFKKHPKAPQAQISLEWWESIIHAKCYHLLHASNSSYLKVILAQHERHSEENTKPGGKWAPQDTTFEA